MVATLVRAVLRARDLPPAGAGAQGLRAGGGGVRRARPAHRRGPRNRAATVGPPGPAALPNTSCIFQTIISKKNISKDDWLWPYRAWGQGAAGASEFYNLYFNTLKIKSFNLVTNEAGWWNWPGHAKSKDKTYPTKGGKVSCNGYDAISWYNTFNDTTKHRELAIAFLEVWAPTLPEKLERGLTKLNGSGSNGSGVPYSQIKTAFEKIPNLKNYLVNLLQFSKQ